MLQASRGGRSQPAVLAWRAKSDKVLAVSLRVVGHYEVGHRETCMFCDGVKKITHLLRRR